MRTVKAGLAVAVAAGLLIVPGTALGGTPGAARGGSAHEFDIQAHRGGIGLRVESTLASFGNALKLGVTTLELDVQITADGQAVVTHDRKVDGNKCADTAPVTPGDPKFPYAGKYVKDLTLAQVETLDCGSKTLPDFPGQLAVPGARMPLLRQVFDLVTRYHADDVKLNVETKVEAGAPDQTAPREQFVQVVAREIRAAGYGRRVTVQSFDWGALMRMRQVAPELPLVALTNVDFLQIGQPGASPWLGGLDIDDFGGDPIKAIRTFRAAAFSPVHTYVTADLVRRAHGSGITVVPWTVDDPATMNKLVNDGVDGIITNYPDRLRAVAAARGFRLPRGYASPFDIQGHRGARAVRPENTLAAFRYSLANPDVSTLEMDTGVTADGILVISHDRNINPAHCADTRPVVPNDPKFPYAGKLIHDLTLAQVKTLDCGAYKGFPGERMPTLAEVFALVDASGRRDIRLNIETKVTPLAPADTEPYWLFTGRLVTAIKAARYEDRVTIQSFDWRTIMLSRLLDRRIHTVALVWQYGPAECATLADECSLQAVYGDPSVRSPWTGRLDWWQFRDLGKLVRASGAMTVSANWQVHDPTQPTVTSPDWYLRQSPAYFHGPAIPRLHDRYGLLVVPYTIDDPAVMQHVIDLGVNGIISDDPDLAVLIARRNGLR